MRITTWSSVVCSSDLPQPTAAPAAPLEVVYVSNEDSNDLTVVSAGDLSVIDTIAVGKRPRGVRVRPDGLTVFVALSGSPTYPPRSVERRVGKWCVCTGSIMWWTYIIKKQ